MAPRHLALMGRLVALIVVAAASGCALSSVVGKLSGAASGSPRASGEQDSSGRLEPREDEGLTSELHRQRVGEIVFSNRSIDKRAPDVEAIRDAFDHRDYIYGRVFMSHSVENHPVYGQGGAGPSHNRSGGYRFRLYIDGERQDWLVENVARSRMPRTRTTQQVLLRPRPEDEPTARSWVELVAGLSPGEHRVRLEMWTQEGGLRSREPIATGEFTLVKNGEDRIAIGRSFEDFEAGMRDPELEASLLDLLQRRAGSKGWKETFTTLRIKSPGWAPHRHPHLKTLLSRRIETWARATWPDGRCTVQAFLFEEQYLGGGRYAGEIRHAGTGTQHDVDCEPIEPFEAPQIARSRTPRQQSSSGERGKPPTGKQAAPARGAGSEIASGSEATTERPGAPAIAAASGALVEPAGQPQVEVERGARRRGSRPGRFTVMTGAGLDARSAGAGLSSYLALSARVSRFELGVAATYPLNLVASGRWNLVDGVIELAPTVAISGLLESDAMNTGVAVAGGLTAGLRAWSGDSLSLGLRLEALASYSPSITTWSVPVLASTYARF